MQKRPVSIALSKRILDKIDQEAKVTKRSRSDWVELHFEELFFPPPPPPTDTSPSAMRFG